ncbi:MAG: hypothetical protein JNK82_12145 [Myxococcaceae bacterium]|nr:hypothetical protein [Myxococcaceae bacterium]
MMLPLLLLLAAPVQLRTSVDGAKPAGGWVYARVGQKVVLHAPLGPEGRWFELKVKEPSVDNTQPSFHFEQLHFEPVELERCRGQATCEVTGPGLPGVPGVGTVAYQVRDGEKASPGVEATKWGGLTKDVHRVTWRLDDTYLGYVTELAGTPYIFGSAGPDGRNQTDLLIGADCADLAVYGQRRLGKKAEYVSTYSIDQQAPEVKGPVKRGDVLHFPSSRHVAVLWEDRPPLGVLDEGDLMLHTCWAPPTIEPIGANPACASKPMRVLRFR